MQTRTRLINSLVRPTTLVAALALALTACGGSSTETTLDGFAFPALGGDTTEWWNAEEQLVGSGAYTNAGVVPVELGTTTWVGAFEIGSEGVPQWIPNALDPDRSELTCSTLSSTLIECLNTQYDGGSVDFAENIRATPGGTAPTGTWEASDDFFPGGVRSGSAYAEYMDDSSVDLDITAYVRPEAGGVLLDGFEQRMLSFGVPALAVGTYTVTTDLLAQGIRVRFPLTGAPTLVIESASAGTLTVTVAGTAPGDRVEGTYSLTFPSGTATGSFATTIIDN